MWPVTYSGEVITSIEVVELIEDRLKMLANGMDPYEYYYNSNGYPPTAGVTGDARETVGGVREVNSYPGQYNELTQNSPESSVSQDYEDDLTDQGEPTTEY